MQTVLILGAGSDLARALARKYASLSYRLILAEPNPDVLREHIRDLEIRSQTSVEALAFDALKTETHEAFYASLSVKPDIVFCVFGYLGNQLRAETDLAERLRMREHAKEELSHYSNGTSDIEYEFPFGWGELWGIASRTSFDLTQHMEHSKVDMRYHDKVTNEKFIPYVVEPALGVDRLLLVLLCDAYEMEKLENGEERSVFHFHPSIAPIKAAVLPLSKDPELIEKAEGLYRRLQKRWPIEFDETQSIGKRYRRQDEIGTPYCITVDFGTIGRDGDEKKDLVTIRDRDTMLQVTLHIDEVEKWLEEKLSV